MALIAYIGGFRGPHILLTGTARGLSYTCVPVGESETPQPEQLDVSDAEWDAFWRELDAIGVWRWRERYEPDVLVTDGTTWELTLEHDGLRLSASGSNAYPPKWERYLAAVSRLAGGRAFE